MAPEEIGGRWEQFHDCFHVITAIMWCRTRRVLSHKKVPEKEAYLGDVLILRNVSVWELSELYIL